MWTVRVSRILFKTAVSRSASAVLSSSEGGGRVIGCTQRLLGEELGFTIQRFSG
jgi:hypothetical protein